MDSQQNKLAKSWNANEGVLDFNKAECLPTDKFFSDKDLNKLTSNICFQSYEHEQGRKLIGNKNVFVKDHRFSNEACGQVAELSKKPLVRQHSEKKNTLNSSHKKYRQGRATKYSGKMTSYLCDTCGKSFAFNKTLLRHQFIQHNVSNPQGIGQRVYQCSVCGMIFRYSELLRRHRLQHEKYLFQCRFCSQPPFTTYNAFRYHTIKFHKDVRCKLCDHPCTGQLEYAKHVKSAHPGIRVQTIVHFKGYSCSQCPAVFTTVEELDDHVRSQHQGIFYDCPECGKQLSSRRGLTVHRRLHNQDSKYRCEECQRPFTQRGHLLQHFRVHHPERLPEDCLLQFSCPDCGKNFKTKSSIKKHRLSKHEGHTYQCSLCMKNFQSKSGFQYHQRRPCSNPAVKPYQQT